MENLNGIHNRSDLFSFIISNVKAEVFLHGKDKFDAIKRVETEVLESSCSSELLVLALGSRLENLKDFAFDVFDELVLVELGELASGRAGEDHGLLAACSCDNGLVLGHREEGALARLSSDHCTGGEEGDATEHHLTFYFISI